jgi:hypothetical protein
MSRTTEMTGRAHLLMPETEAPMIGASKRKKGTWSLVFQGCHRKATQKERKASTVHAA